MILSRTVPSARLRASLTRYGAAAFGVSSLTRSSTQTTSLHAIKAALSIGGSSHCQRSAADYPCVKRKPREETMTTTTIAAPIRRRAARSGGHAAADQGYFYRLDRQSGRVVRLLRLCRLRALFCRRLFPEFRSRRAAAQCRAVVRGGLSGAAVGRMAVRLSGRSSRPARRLDAFGFADVLRFADDRGDADLCVDRHLCADPACGRAHHSGPEPRRRIRHQRDVSDRNGGPAPSRLLFQLPIRHLDRRPDLRAARAFGPAESLPDRRRNPRLGLAHPVLHRRAVGADRARHAAHPAGDRRFRSGETGREADLVAARADEISARGSARGRD